MEQKLKELNNVIEIQGMNKKSPFTRGMYEGLILAKRIIFGDEEQINGEKALDVIEEEEYHE